MRPPMPPVASTVSSELATTKTAELSPLTNQRIPLDDLLTLSGEAKSLVGLAAPLYYERLSSIPYYAAKKGDINFWNRYVLSRVSAARAMVIKHQAQMASSTENSAMAK